MIFPAIDGNEKLKSILEAPEYRSRMPHAVIIEGGSESDRAALAKWFSMWAVCESEDDKPCGSCKGCHLAETGAHSDIRYAKGEGKTESYSKKVMEEIIEDSYRKPYIADTKAYVFLDCERRLPVISQNIFLKTLEEPPANVIFILTCETAKSLLDTIRSRSSVVTLESRLSVNEEHFELAKRIAAGIVSNSEMDLLKAAYELNGRDKAASTLDLVILLLRDGLAVYLNTEPELDRDTAELLCRRLTKKNYLELIDITRDAQVKISQNVGLNLVATRLCAEYRRALWQR